MASVEVGQLAVTTGEEVAAFAKVGQLFGLKKKQIKGEIRLVFLGFS